MAYSAERWERAKAYYTAGLSLREIEAKTGINNSSIQKKAKAQQWKHGGNSDYIEAKVIIAEKKSAENSAVIRVLDDIADEQIRHKQLINSNAELIASKIPTMLEQIDSPSDLKTLAEANDRLAITLKIADRHAPKQDISVNATAGAVAQVDNRELSHEELERELKQRGIPLDLIGR